MSFGFVFATGAGLPQASPWMDAWAARLGAFGPVVRFDYPYLASGRKRPDPMPVLLEAHRDALATLRSKHPGARPILAGKSMGSRVGCHLSVEEPVAGLICFGYPLFGQGDPKKSRDAVLRQLRAPLLFVQGTRDPLCPLDALAGVRSGMTSPTTLHVVETGDHSLQVTRAHEKATGRSQEFEDQAVVEAIRAWLAALPPVSGDAAS